MAIYKDRNLVPVNETWDLQRFLGKKTLEENIKEVLTKADGLMKAYPKRFDTLANFVAYHDLLEEFVKARGLTFQFLGLHCEQDTLSPYRSKLAELSMLVQPVNQILGTDEAEVLKNKAKVIKFLADDRLEKYRRHYELIFRNEPHILPYEVAAYDAQISQAYESNGEVFSVLRNAETKYEPALDAKNKKHEVTTQSFSTLQRSRDRTLRMNSYESYTKGNMITKETFTKLIAGHFLAQHRKAQVIGFKTQVEASMFGDNAEPALVQSLYAASKNNHAPSARRSKAARTFLAKALKIKYDQVMPYDMEYELFPAAEDYSVKQAKDMVLSSVKPLGKDYAKLVEKALNSRWVDFHMTPNKRNGAFSAGTHFCEMKPILMNFNGTLDSVSTLAHEIGHSMHSLHCHSANPFPLSDYPIFTAEVASNFSELLLTEEILRTSKSDKVKFNALETFLDNFAGNVYRQLLFSEYEYNVSEALLQNKSVSTWDEISKIFAAVEANYVVHKDWNKKYGERTKIASVIVPHFYYDFYVYKYSIGMIGALALMALLKKDAKKGAENYIKFISSGTQEWPAEVLKSVGVDLYDQKTLKKAFDLYADYVDQYITLGKKLLKVTAPL